MRRATAILLSAALLLAVAPMAGALPLSGGPADDDLHTYIVTLHDPPVAAYTGGIAGLAATAPEATGALRLDVDDPAVAAYRAHLRGAQDAALTAISVTVGRALDIGLRYDAVLNGFTVELTDDEASDIAALPVVRRVDPDIMLELHTDNGPRWIGAEAVWAGGDATGGADGNRGAGVVVGIIDTGVNFRHPAFAEVGPVDGHVHDNPRGRFYGLCDPISGFPYCNNKLIGMWDFATLVQPQDEHGHGSHVASTAAGNVLEMTLDAPTISIDRTISGVAPHANIISYKACVVIGSCPLSATLGSINQAALDAVDVVNFSIGGGSSNPWSSLLAQAFLNTRAAGVFIATSAGNSGPGPGTVGDPANAPWVLSVGASTHDRDFPNILADLAGGAEPAPPDLSGKGLTAGMDAPARVVYAGDYGNELCGEGTLATPINPFPPGTFNGEIVVCDRGEFARVDKARHVAEAGAGGFVLANDEASGDSLNADPYVLPGVHLTFADGELLKAWIEAGGGADNQGTGIITGSFVDESPDNADVMAAFSSRGPNAPVPDVIKPDITAPGVDILAAWEGLLALDDPATYNSISGTSMSSPHAAGAAALLRALQPEWRPDEVRSALMTTAFTDVPGTGDEVRSVVKEDGQTPADAFDHGAGRIDLRQAARAGLLLDETTEAYRNADPAAGGDPSGLNLPSMAAAACSGTCSWTRLLRGATTGEVTWQVVTDAPEGVTLTVEPASFSLPPGELAQINVTADVTAVTTRDWQFGEVRLVPDDPAVPETHLPVAVRADAEDLPPAPDVDLLQLHFRGNLGDEHGCTGDGRLDVALCDGPYLSEDGELSSQPAARFGPVSSAVNGAAARNIHDPNWTWYLDEEVTVGGPMTVHWWAACPACGVFDDDWTLRLWADGELVFEERITATPDPLLLPTALEATVEVPEVTATETLTLHVDPVYVDTQQATFVYYDSTSACPGASDGPCGSYVLLPIPREDVGAADLSVIDATATEVPARHRNDPGDRVRVTATVANLGTEDAPASHTEFWVRGDDGRVDLLGWIPTPAIPAGEAVAVTASWDTRGLNGRYTVIITADIAQEVADADRSNNVGHLHTVVRGNRVIEQRFESQ